MPYNGVISRGEVPVDEDYSSTIVDNAQDQSVAMSLFERATLSKSSRSFPVLATLPTAYWVNGDTGLKQTTGMSWSKKYIEVEELAAIVPIPENVIDDSDFDIWGEVRPKLETAIARALDSAIFWGTDAPASFPTNVRAAAISAGNTVAEGTNATAAGGAFGDLDDVIGKMEDDGFDVSGWGAARVLRKSFRKARSTQGESLDRDRVNAQFTEFDGDPVVYGARGLWPVKASGVKGLLALALDRTNFVLGVRKDMTYKILDQAVITDGSGSVVFNLPQQDMIGLRVTFRAGWQVANVINYDEAVEANRYPAVVYETVVG
jgi:HK97 family phage major capsid protein